MELMLVDVVYCHCPFLNSHVIDAFWFEDFLEWEPPNSSEPNESHWLIPTWEVFESVSL